MWTSKLKFIEREYQWICELIWVAVFVCLLLLAWKMFSN